MPKKKYEDTEDKPTWVVTCVVKNVDIGHECGFGKYGETIQMIRVFSTRKKALDQFWKWQVTVISKAVAKFGLQKPGTYFGNDDSEGDIEFYDNSETVYSAGNENSGFWMLLKITKEFIR